MNADATHELTPEQILEYTGWMACNALYGVFAALFCGPAPTPEPDPGPVTS